MTDHHSTGFPSRPIWEDQNERIPTATEKLWKKSKEDPFVPIGEYVEQINVHTHCDNVHWEL